MYRFVPIEIGRYYLLEVQVLDLSRLTKVLGSLKFKPLIVEAEVTAASLHQQDQAMGFAKPFDLASVGLTIVRAAQCQRVDHRIERGVSEGQTVGAVSLEILDLVYLELAFITQLLLFVHGFHQHVGGPVHRNELLDCLSVET